MLYCVISYWITLYYVILRYIMLYYAIFYCIMLYYITLCYIMLYCVILCHITLHYVVLYHIISQFTSVTPVTRCCQVGPNRQGFVVLLLDQSLKWSSMFLCSQIEVWELLPSNGVNWCYSRIEYNRQDVFIGKKFASVLCEQYDPCTTRWR